MACAGETSEVFNIWMVCGNTDHGDDALVCSQMLPSDWYYVIIGNNFIEEFEMDYQIWNTSAVR
jgi:hypothetical protein